MDRNEAIALFKEMGELFKAELLKTCLSLKPLQFTSKASGLICAAARICPQRVKLGKLSSS